MSTRSKLDPPRPARPDLPSDEWNPHEIWRCRIRVPRRLYAAIDVENCAGLELIGEEEETADADCPQVARFVS